MKAVTVIGLAMVLALGVSSAAEALDGCGGGMHRNRYGHCVVNSRHTAYVDGRYYAHRGYWHDARWYNHRYSYHHHWRYR
jgi:hypothetical protein